MLQDEAYAVDALVDLAPPPPNKNDLDSNSNPGGSSGLSMTKKGHKILKANSGVIRIFFLISTLISSSRHL